MDSYERKMVASQIRLFYSNKPDEFIKPYTKKDISDYWKEVDQIAKQIEDVERFDEIIEGMQALYETLTPDSRNYEEDKKHFAIVKDYRAGRYNLFPNSPYRRKTPFKALEAEVKQEPVEERKTPTEDDIPPSEYDFHLGTTVYIGTDECEITSIDSERVELFDGTLIPLEMDYATFISRVRDNDLNDHLKKKAEEKIEQNPAEEPKQDFSSNPILRRYQEAKQAYPQHLAMVRVGDFYEFFGDDAVKVAKVLDIAMTSRPINETERIPMCGVPYHIVDKYLEKILDADLSVAIFEDGNITTKEVQEVEVIRKVNGNYLLLGEDAELAAPILKKECKTRTLLDGRRLSVCELEPYLTHQHYADLREHNIKIMELSLQDVTGRGEMPILLDPSVVSKNECDAVYAFLNATHLYDVEVEFDYDTSEVVAKDEENEWRGKDLFEFLLNEVVALDENYMLVEGMGNNQPEVDALIKYAEQYGAKIRTVKRNAPELEATDDFDDINPEEIRENLAKHGIVDGVVVDEDALNNSDFIRQVMSDVGEEDLTDEELDSLPISTVIDGEVVTFPNAEAMLEATDTAPRPTMQEKPKAKPTLPVYNAHPEIPDSQKHNYRIVDDNLGIGGAKEKFKRNMAAINLLHELETQNRLATPEEQEILAQYTGWGGLSDAFDETKDNWSSEFTELYEALSPDEYRDAKESTLTAFYTPPVVIRAMYEALEKMGLKRGNILEPSCGIGNFMGMLPDSMSESKIYGVELDSLTGRIARQLYQKSGITIDGYEKTHFPDSFFDVAVGNVPFGQFKVVDKKYDKHKPTDDLNKVLLKVIDAPTKKEKRRKERDER